MKKIIHLDLDCFFAAVEMREDPTLINQPIAVGGQGPRSVVATCNYPAREYGVRSAMSVAKALKLCPSLRLLPVRLNLYREASKSVFDIVREYSDTVEMASIDEAYIDVSNSPWLARMQNSAALIAEHLRAKILAETGLTASAGVSSNKFLAKIAGEINKPNGQFVLPPKDQPAFCADLPLRKIPGIGEVTAKRLNKLGLVKGADVLPYSHKELTERLGKLGELLYARVRGQDDRPLTTDRTHKSMSCETTLDEDLNNSDDCLKVLKDLRTGLLERVAKVKKLQLIKTVGVVIKCSDFQLSTIEQRSRDITIPLIESLLLKGRERTEHKPIRLLGLKVSFGKAEKSVQGSLI